MKKLKLIIPIFLIFLMSISIASAGLTTLSGSQIDFLGNDDTFSSAYLVSVVENGGSDKIYFADFPSPSGYTKESNSGYISGDLTKGQVEYNFNQRSYRGSVYNMVALNGGNTKYFLGWGSAMNWCDGLTSDPYFLAVKDWGGLGIGNYYCYHTNEVGQIGDIGGPNFEWEEKFTIYNRVSGESSSTSTLTLNNQDTSGAYEWSTNRKVRAKYAFSGGNVNSYMPQLTNGYSVFYQSGGVKTIDHFSPTENIFGSRYDTWFYFGEQWIGENAWDKVVVQGGSTSTATVSRKGYLIENEINSYINSHIGTQTIREADWSTANVDQSSGTITMTRTDGQFPVANVFTMKIDAEWIGIEEPVTIPVVESWESSGSKFIEGDYNAGFNAVVRNDGDTGTFKYSITCSPSGYVSIDSRNQEQIGEGQKKNFFVRAYANTAGENINAECCIQVSDYSDPTIKSLKVCDDITFLESNQCPSGMEAGHSSCAPSGEIQQCMKNNDGVLVLQGTGVVCQNGCSVSGSTATCSAPPQCRDNYDTGSSCGDGRCESFERTGKDCECLDDCSTCGDKYCSALEKEADNCPQDCGAAPYCGNDICGLNEYGIQETDVKGTAGYCPADCGDPKPPGGNTPLIIFGILGGGAIAGAITLRLKKDGYIGKK